MNVSFFSKLLFVFFFGFVSTDVDVFANEENVITSNWDYIVFTQQWPETVCSAWKEKGPENTCNFPDGLHSWTIHGVWPSYDKGMGPQFCNSTWAFNVTKIENLMTNLRQHWPNIYKDTSEDEFWAHEWNKHGTCAASDTLIHNEFGYFDAGLTMAAKYNVTVSLSLAGIVPNSAQSYTVSLIESAMKSHFGVEPVIVCYRDKKTKAYLIKEIRLCVDKSLSLITCVEQAKQQLGVGEEGCAKDGTVYYLPVNFTSNVRLEDESVINHEEL